MIKKIFVFLSTLRNIFFILKYIQLSLCINHLLYRNNYISYCLCAGLVQLQLILQVHYINTVQSHNNNLHAIKYVHNIVVNGMRSQTDSLREMDMLNDISLITIQGVTGGTDQTSGECSLC